MSDLYVFFMVFGAMIGVVFTTLLVELEKLLRRGRKIK